MALDFSPGKFPANWISVKYSTLTICRWLKLLLNYFSTHNKCEIVTRMRKGPINSWLKFVALCTLNLKPNFQLYYSVPFASHACLA